MESTPLRFAGQASPGDNAVVAGYPLDAQSLHTVPARIGGIQNAQGPNIYQTSTVTRQIYEIRAVVESGNSGGPLLSANGTVDGVVFAAAVDAADTGFATAGEFTGGCADSGFTAGVGAPTICAVGPVGGMAHSPDEFLRIDSLVPRAQACARAILRLERAGL